MGGLRVDIRTMYGASHALASRRERIASESASSGLSIASGSEKMADGAREAFEWPAIA
jgi:hypothetical protein